MLGLIPWHQFSCMPTCTSEWILSLLRPRPDVESLPAETTLRLYTATNTRCVAEGDVVDYGERTCGDTRLVIGRRGEGATRMVLRLRKKYIPGALALHPQEDGGEPQALDLWDAVSWEEGVLWTYCHFVASHFPSAVVNSVFAMFPEWYPCHALDASPQVNSRLPKEPPPTSTVALDAGAGAGSSAGAMSIDAEGVIGGSSSGEAPKPLVKQDL